MKKLTLFLLACSLSNGLLAANKKLKVYILAGQSNMQGHCTTSVIENRFKDPKLKVGFEKYHQGGTFVKRNDVFINHIEKEMHGPMSVGYGASNDKIDPELSFGWTIGDKLDEDVLIIKAAWGGKSLFCDFLPPSGRKPDDAFIQALEDKAKKNNPLSPPCIPPNPVFRDLPAKSKFLAVSQLNTHLSKDARNQLIATLAPKSIDKGSQFVVPLALPERIKSKLNNFFMLP